MKNLSAIGMMVSWFLLGCMSSGDLSEFDTFTPPSEQVKKLESLLQTAKEKGIASLSPRWFTKAKEALNEAKRLQEKGRAEPEIAAKVDEGNNAYTKASHYAALCEQLLSKTIRARAEFLVAFEEAKVAGAAGLSELEEDYADTETEFLKLTRSIENDDSEWAQENQDETHREFMILEIRAIKKAILDTARRTIDEAERLGAGRYAPKALATAEFKLQLAEKYIGLNSKQRTEIKRKGDQSLFFANRVLHLTKQGRFFSGKDPEEIALWMEKQLTGIGNLITSDNRDKHFETQVNEIRHSIVELKKNSSGLASETRKLRANVETLSTKVEKSREVLEWEKKVADVKRQFDENEAEVVQESGKITIRLRTIRFPVGQAGLLPESFGLLTKVQRAIQAFDEADVTVEGHTDSTGSRTVNERLSLQRARSVKEYLVANRVISGHLVSVAGLGFSRPLVSDKSPGGSAINRRIDVVIKPIRRSSYRPRH